MNRGDQIPSNCGSRLVVMKNNDDYQQKARADDLTWRHVEPELQCINGEDKNSDFMQPERLQEGEPSPCVT